MTRSLVLSVLVNRFYSFSNLPKSNILPKRWWYLVTRRCEIRYTITVVFRLTASIDRCHVRKQPLVNLFTKFGQIG